jgi:hypothetical protein
MSEDSLNRLNEIINLTQKHGKIGIRLLFLFKLLKIKVKEKIEKDYPTITIKEENLNRLCIQKAQELVKLEKDEPTEKDIKELLSRLNAQE